MFVNLHNHSHYSLLDGLPMPEEYVRKAKEQGSPGVALTDHGALYGVLEFYMAAKKQEINPIIGCETYLTPYDRQSRNPAVDTKRFHLVLLAKNNRGYQNLITLITKAHLEGMYYKPRIDWNLLEEYGQDLIALSACLGGELSQAILAGKDLEEVWTLVQRYQQTFGAENFFLELQHHPQLAEQVQVNQALIELARAKNIPLVATSDAHYIEPEDNIPQDILLCIQTDRHVDDAGRLSMMQTDCSLHAPQQMMEWFQATPQAISNTLEINRMCSVDISLGKNLMPSFPVPSEKTPQQYLRELCYHGMQQRYQWNFKAEDIALLASAPQEGLVSEESIGAMAAEEMQQILSQTFTSEKNQRLADLKPEQRNIIYRLEYELLVIHQMKFDTYFLIVQDFVLWAKQRGISVGPGRGSVGGSLVAYALRITELDPLQYDLLFERFLNPARISMPDIDLDFADTRRDEVLEYVREKYGRDHVAQVSTFGTMAAKQAVKDVGRALGIAYAEMNEVAKLIPDRPGTKLSEALTTQPELKKLYDSNPLYKKVFDIALKLEGVVRHVSVHACAVVIADEPLTRYTALQNPPNNKDVVITQLSAKPLEYLGLLKMDFLGLSNLSIIQKTLHILERTKNTKIDLGTVPLDDKKTLELFCRAETTGVFQFESAGMKRYLKELKPSSFEDIIAMVALYRPGPMDWIPDYIAYKHGRKKVHYPHAELADILEKTYGIAIYQEQILQIVQKFAGFSLGEADILRRAIGKKIASELLAQKEKFVAKAQAKDHSHEEALFIFERVIEPFANYGFNKSHAACYALISYQTAYLKAHYPAEFMASLLSSDAENLDRVAIEAEECRKMGIELLPPSVNESLSNFTVVNPRVIRFGLRGIKGLGEGTVDQILEERKKSGSFQDIFDFARRVPVESVNKKSLEALIFSGAMDMFGSRNVLGSALDMVLDFAHHVQTKERSGQNSLFATLETESNQAPALPQVPVETNLEKLRWEKQYLGLYVSGHPLDGLKKYFSKKATLIERLTPKDVGKTQTVMGLIVRAKKIFTKSKEPMLALTIEDPTGTIEAMIFSRVYKILTVPLAEDMLVVVTGRLDRRNEDYLLSVQEVKTADLSHAVERAKAEKFFDPEQKVSRVKVVLEDVVETEHASAELTAGSSATESTTGGEAAETENTPEPNTPEMFTTTEVLPDYIIEVPTACGREELLRLRQVVEEHAGNGQEVIFQYNGNRIKTNLRVQVDQSLEEKLRGIVAGK